MVEYIYLQSDEQMPKMANHEAWLVIEAASDGRFFGSGYGFKPSGEGVFYASLAESDLTFEAAIAAATEWARERGVPRIWIQTAPDRRT